MLYAFLSREQLLKFLPPGGCVAEIGVFRGDFSEAILAAAKPSRLHLIDPWSHQTGADYQLDDSNLSDAGHVENLRHVQQRFAEQIATGQVVLHRDRSENVAAEFTDASLDWIYVDGRHTFDAVFQDLELYRAKVKPGGFILGHDFTNHPDCVARGYGVVPAVGRFRKARGFDLILLTAESCPSYVLAREPLGESATLLVEKIIYNVPQVMEIKGFAEERFAYRQVILSNGAERILPSF
jgi:hypothetical protein